MLNEVSTASALVVVCTYCSNTRAADVCQYSHQMHVDIPYTSAHPHPCNPPLHPPSQLWDGNATAIFARENAMVVAVESMRAVITHKFAMFLTVPNEDQPQMPAEPNDDNLFIRELIRRILRNRLEHVSLQAGFPSAHEALGDIRQPHFDTGLPFEFVVLETMLATATRILHVELRDLEDVALSNIEAMARKVSRETLEGVREVKLRLTALTRRALRLERVCL